MPAAALRDHLGKAVAVELLHGAVHSGTVIASDGGLVLVDVGRGSQSYMRLPTELAGFRRLAFRAARKRLGTPLRHADVLRKVPSSVVGARIDGAHAKLDIAVYDGSDNVRWLERAGDVLHVVAHPLLRAIVVNGHRAERERSAPLLGALVRDEAKHLHGRDDERPDEPVDEHALRRICHHPALVFHRHADAYVRGYRLDAQPTAPDLDAWKSFRLDIEMTDARWLEHLRDVAFWCAPTIPVFAAETLAG